MTKAIRQDANNHLIQGMFAMMEPKAVSFTGAAGNGAVGTVDLFTVTGDIAVMLILVCSDSLVSSGGTLGIGVSGSVNQLMAGANAFAASDLDAGESSTFDQGADPAVGAQSYGGFQVLQGGADIIATIATANITDGDITVYAFWYPLSEDGDLEAA